MNGVLYPLGFTRVSCQSRAPSRAFSFLMRSGCLDGAALDSKIADKVESPVARHADTRPGASDPQHRLKDQALDNLRAEMIYPGQWSLMLYRIADAEYQRAAVRVYNDWLSEFCAYKPSRLLGAAILPMQGPLEWATEEAEP